MKIKTIKTEIFRPRQNLYRFIEKYLPELNEGDILVVTSKIVALAEGRLLTKKSGLSKEEIIKRESDWQLRTKYVYLTIKDDTVMANAGIDESNANGGIILLPRDSYLAAARTRNYFKRRRGLKKIGVIITDSRCLPLRAGVSGVALGYAGFRGLKDYRQEKDIFGRPFEFSRVAVADSLAAAAVLGMGEGNEQRPLAIIRQAPVEYQDEVERDELKISLKEDIYGPLFKKIL